MLQSLCRAGFFLALVVVLLLTLEPADLVASPINDKAAHLLAFAGLAFIGAIAWPRRAATIAVCLAILGATIEVIQGTHWIGRDAEFLDFVADCLGVGAGLSCAAVFRSMRNRRRATA